MTEIKRETKETKIEIKLNVNGSGKSAISTGVGFFDHMLEALAKHSGMDLEVYCDGDVYVDYHHTVEDVGIVLGEALYKEVFPVENIERYANAVAVLDEAAVEVDMDIGGRPYLVYEVPRDGVIKDFDMELAEEFFKSLVFNFKIAAHIVYKRGTNKHHIIESAFKAFAVALRRALAYRNSGVPSTKGIL
ncbi:imidazoleglycerol-phosphate dehydratase HisB [Nautilia sp.]